MVGGEINKQRRNKAEAAAIQPKGARAAGGSEAGGGGDERGSGGAHRCNKVHRAGRIKRSSITTWGPGAAYFIRPRELGCGILFRALGMLSTAKNFHKTAICHLRRHSSLSPCLCTFPLVFVFRNSRPVLPPAFSLFFPSSPVPRETGRDPTKRRADAFPLLLHAVYDQPEI